MVPSTPWSSAPSAAPCAPGPPQCADVNPIRSPLLSWPIVVSVQKVSPLTTMPEPPPSGTGSTARANGAVKTDNAAVSAAMTTTAVTASYQRCLNTPPSVAPTDCSPNHVSLTLAGRVEPSVTWQHEPH